MAHHHVSAQWQLSAVCVQLTIADAVYLQAAWWPLTSSETVLAHQSLL